MQKVWNMTYFYFWLKIKNSVYGDCPVLKIGVWLFTHMEKRLYSLFTHMEKRLYNKQISFAIEVIDL